MIFASQTNRDVDGNLDHCEKWLAFLDGGNNFIGTPGGLALRTLAALKSQPQSTEQKILERKTQQAATAIKCAGPHVIEGGNPMSRLFWWLGSPSRVALWSSACARMRLRSARSLAATSLHWRDSLGQHLSIGNCD